MSTIGYEGDLYLLGLNCLAEPDGCFPTLIQLEDPGSLDWFPAISPDGTKVAFVSNRAGSGDSLYMIDLESRALRRLTRASGDFRDLAWSPDGRTLAFSYRPRDDGPQSIATLDTQGGAIVPFPGIREYMAYPTWSPDGQFIAFIASDNWPSEPYSNLYVADAKGNEITQLGPDQPSFYGPAMWSPDGTTILTSIWPKPDLVLIRVADSRLTYLTNTSDDEEAPYWSPDGHWLAYAVVEGDLWYIRVRDVPGQAVYTIAGPFDEYAGPFWAPDGSFIAFDARAGEYRQAFLAAPDGSWIQQVTTADTPLFVDSIWTP